MPTERIKGKEDVVRERVMEEREKVKEERGGLQETGRRRPKEREKG